MTSDRNGRRCVGDRGSVLLLFPAGFIIVMVMAAIAADMGHVNMSKASLSDLASTVANDVSTAALDREMLREGLYIIDQRAASRIAHRVIATRSNETMRVAEPADIKAVRSGPSLTITVALKADVPYFFAKAIPGSRDHVTITASSEVTLVDQR